MSSNYVIPFGKKYKGRNLAEVPRAEIEGYIQWLEKQNGASDKPEVRELKRAFDELYLKPATTPSPAKDMSAKQQGRKPNDNKNNPYGPNANGNVKRTFKTAKGTELPLINLKGKEYLEVKYRLVWFREDHPNWSIETEYVQLAERHALAKAFIKDESGKIVSTSHKFENVQGFGDFIEKSETGAVGRALALLGYGTQFCADELDEGERIVDAPVGHGHPNEPDTPSAEKGPVIAVKLKGRNKAEEKMLHELGYIYDWVNHAHVKYYNGPEDVSVMPFEYEIWESPPGI